VPSDVAVSRASVLARLFRGLYPTRRFGDATRRWLQCQFDFVLANPPFNVNAVDKERLKDMVGAGRRFPLGLPRTDNANYLWIQLFYSALNATGRAGFVMANSASDARASEQELRQKLIEARAVDVMVAVGPNMFYTVTLPCTLWFLDKGKANTPRADTVLFIDARHIYRQVDRAHRDWTPAQIGFIANLTRLYRGEALDLTVGNGETEAKLKEVFGDTPTYADVPGLCKVATLKEIEAQGWSLNPGRYVGVRLRLMVQNDAVVVPERAVGIGSNGQFVFLVKADRSVERRSVQVARTYDDDAVIAAGVEEGGRASLTAATSTSSPESSSSRSTTLRNSLTLPGQE